MDSANSRIFLILFDGIAVAVNLSRLISRRDCYASGCSYARDHCGRAVVRHRRFSPYREDQAATKAGRLFSAKLSLGENLSLGCLSQSFHAAARGGPPL